MPDISFDSQGKVVFPTKYHGNVTFSKRKWDDICGKPERYYYRLNGEKIATTLVAPDIVKHHNTEPTQFIYYKEFARFKIVEGVEGPAPCKYMAVVIDTATGRACTAYPTDRPKNGSKDYEPGKS